MNRREAMLAGLGMAVGAAVGPSVSPAAISTGMDEGSCVASFTMISFYGSDGWQRSFRLPENAPRYLLIRGEELVGSNSPNGPFEKV